MAALSRSILIRFSVMLQSYNPELAETISVWANPRSLATTYGITIVFSSCRYLDVSVPCVRLLSDTLAGGFPHSEIYGSTFACNSP
jgi:hypothetical protein